MKHAETGLWSVYADTIRLWRPPVVVIENVTALRARGLDVVLRDLHDARYDAFWAPLKASDVGAPHARSRLFIVAKRRGIAPTTIKPGPPPPMADWDAPLPVNDFDTPDRRPRVAAMGDAVVPAVAYRVGLTVADVFSGWWPESRPTRDPIPVSGALVSGEVTALRTSPWGVPTPSRRWVTVMQPTPPWPTGAKKPRHTTEWVAAPHVGRLYVPMPTDADPDDQVDVEVLGGYGEPYPAGWLRPGWPTPTRHDAAERGSASTWERHSPALSTLMQGHPWRGAVDGWQGWALLDEVSGQGNGPGAVEWAMGFSAGWTSP